MKKFLLFVLIISITIGLFAAQLWENPVQLTKVTNANWNRCGAETNDGGMIYAWSDSHLGKRCIFAEKVWWTGTHAWTQSLNIDSSPYYHVSPMITKTSDGNFIITYLEYHDYEQLILKAQKISSSGQLLWQNNGITVSSVVQHYESVDIISDNNGGAYITWVYNASGIANLYAQKINSNGSFAWQVNGITISTEVSEVSTVTDNLGGLICSYVIGDYTQKEVNVSRILPGGLQDWSYTVENSVSNYIHQVMVSSPDRTSFIVTWHGYTADENNPVSYIKAQRISLSGSALWDSPITINSDSQTLQTRNYLDYRMIVADSTSVIIAWEDDRSGLQTDIYAQKLDLAGSKLWYSTGIPVCINESYQGEIRMTPDTNGGCYIAWCDARDGGDDNRDIYAQHINSIGIADWITGGTPVCNVDGRHLYPLIKLTNNQIFIAWQDERSGSMEIYYKMLFPAGNSYNPVGGERLFEGNDGDVSSPITLRRNNDVVIIWEDFRKSYRDIRLYYQVINPYGGTILEENGSPITNPPVDNQQYPSAITLPDGKIAIVWIEGASVKTQLIDVNGSRLWGDDGMLISQDAGYSYESAKISYSEGAIYISWAQNVTVQLPQYPVNCRYLYGQKIENNTKMWGENGILISHYTPDNQYFNCHPEQLIGRYFIWINDNESNYSRDVFIKLLNSDGTTAAGWPETGLSVAILMPENNQYYLQSSLTNSGLCILWMNYYDVDEQSKFGQLISPQGQRLWNPAGLVLSLDSDRDQISQLLEGTKIYGYMNVDSLYCNLKLQNLSDTGMPLWTESGINLTQPVAGIFDGNVRMTKFDNNGMLAVWSRNNRNSDYPYMSDIYGQYINPDGTLVSTAFPLANEPDDEAYPSIVSTGNDAYVFWAASDLYKEQNRCEDEYPQTYSLYVQRFSNEFVANDDETETPVAVRLEQNYPNPFNPTTNISFSLKSKSSATLTIYNQKGQKVRTIHDGLLDKGAHSFTWNGKDDNDKSVASGVYMYRLSSGNTNHTRKMVLLK